MMQHFPTALGVDDWISRVETVLAGYGFTGDNTIGKSAREGLHENCDSAGAMVHLGSDTL